MPIYGHAGHRGKGGLTGSRGSGSSLLPVSDLRLSQDFAELAQVEELLAAVPVRRPHPQHFFRVHPSEEYRLTTQILEMKEDREAYIVARQLWDALHGESGFGPRLIVTTVTRQGVLSLWPLRLPRSDGRTDNWATSALAAVKEAETRWVRMAADMHLGAYRIVRAIGEIPEPLWPDRSFEEILSEGFKERFINGLDHPVLQKLRGEL